MKPRPTTTLPRIITEVGIVTLVALAFWAIGNWVGLHGLVVIPILPLAAIAAASLGHSLTLKLISRRVI